MSARVRPAFASPRSQRLEQHVGVLGVDHERQPAVGDLADLLDRLRADRAEVDRDPLLHRLGQQLQRLAAPVAAARGTRGPRARRVLRASAARTISTYSRVRRDRAARTARRTSPRRPAGRTRRARAGSARRTARRASRRPSRSPPAARAGICNSPEPSATRSVLPASSPSTETASWPHASEIHTESSPSSSASTASSTCSCGREPGPVGEEEAGAHRSQTLARRPAVIARWHDSRRAPRHARAAPDRPAGVGRARAARGGRPQRRARDPARADARRRRPRRAAAPGLAGAAAGRAAARRASCGAGRWRGAGRAVRRRPRRTSTAAGWGGEGPPARARSLSSEWIFRLSPNDSTARGEPGGSGAPHLPHPAPLTSGGATPPAGASAGTRGVGSSSPSDGSARWPSWKPSPRISPVTPRRSSRAISCSPRRRAGSSSGRPAISVRMRLRSCSAKCGVEAPISWRTSSTDTW